MIFEVLTKNGQYVVAMPKGHKWGACERDPAKFQIEETDDLPESDTDYMIEMAGSGATFMASRIGLAPAPEPEEGSI